jgi:PAS domain S-box-containing protein
MLQDSNTFNQSLIDTLPFPLQIVDEEGTILFMNPIFENLVGIEKIGCKCWEVYRDNKEQCETCPLLNNLPIGHINKTEFSGVFDGRSFDITSRSMLFNGKKALMEIFIDTTERKQYEEHLVVAKNQALESDRLKSAFLANMSHEIRTPMNGILGFLDLLEDVNLTQDEREHFISIIKASGDRLLSTINDIIELSKIEAGEIPLKLTENNLGDSIRYLTEFFSVEAEAKGITLHSEKLDYYIQTDFHKLDAVLTNLIKNAIKFTKTGSISFGYELKKDKLQFYVKDTGSGIAPDQIEIIFNRFMQADNSFSRGYEGSGLGLSISMAYVKMLGGKIWVESEVGKGSTFYFTIDFIPVETTIENEQTLKQYKLHDDIPKAQILIAEDDELSYLLIESLLDDSGYELIRALNGKEAIEKLKENPFIAMILMDLKMPEMDGITATQQIRQFDKDLPIIAQTAFALLGDREKALEVGCNDYISKPIKKYQLLQLIKKYLK